MKTYIATVALVFALVGCASTSPSTKAKHTLKTAKGYKIGDVNVTLVDNVFYDFSEEQKHYPNEKKLSILFEEDIEKYLKQQGMYCQTNQGCLTIDIDINYQRNFNIGSVSTSAPIFDRTITILNGESPIYSNTQIKLKPYRDGIVGKSLNEFAMLVHAGEDKANLDDELEYIEIISLTTVKDIVQLAQ